MNILKNQIVLALFLVALLVYLANWLPIQLPSWVVFYLNDLLCMPIVLSLCLAVVRLYKKSNNIYAPITIVYGLTFFYTVYFEWILPQINGRYTGDLIDVVLYFIGATLFLLFQRRLF
ncbi:MAG: hypothetical protein ACJARX_000809 [Psychroserpens sp.]|jgi:hypothetical protein|uniref:hypothetical protein n=1 Tax=Psychroserpens sp. TaxID=2020870 RepID=UPI0039E29A58